MATLPDVDLSEAAWTDLYTATGIAVGTELLVTNKSPQRRATLVQESVSLPDPTDDNGEPVLTGQSYVVTAGATSAYAIGKGKLVVQENL